MANTLSDFFPKLLAAGLRALRQQAIMPRLVNRGYEAEAGQKGSTITIPSAAAVAVTNVTPGPTPPANVDLTSASLSIVLDQWKEARFYLSDKDKLEVANGFLPLQAEQAIKSLANAIDNAILALYANVYGYVGVAGTTPFSANLDEAAQARKVLNQQLAPMDPRYVVVDPVAEANLLLLRAIQDASFNGSREGLTEGQIGRKLGADWFMDQNIPTHAAGTAAGATTNTAGYALGVKTVTLASAGTGTILVGDVITFAGDSQTYAVTSGDADVSNGGTVSFEPGLKVAIPTSATAITLKASHVVNLAFHRDAFAFASRPLASADDENLGNYMTAVDPVSGLSLRLERSREYKQTAYSFDTLYGVKTVRPELAARIAG